MPPNTINIPVGPEPETIKNGSKSPSKPDPNFQNICGNCILQIFQVSINLVSHILIGCILAISLMFTFRNGLPLNATSLHVTLCVIGYQLLMAQAILSLSPENSWSAKMALVHKKRVHWILQVVGSVLAIIGSIIKILDKSVHFNTLHGQFALVALVFTSASLVNGMTSLWAHQLHHIISGKLSKITHICFGSVAFVAASTALCYGFQKHPFSSWCTEGVAHTFIGFVSILTFLIIVNPLITFYRRSMTAMKRF